MHEGSHETAVAPNAGGASQDLPQVYNLREVADDVRDMAAISELPGRPPGATPSLAASTLMRTCSLRRVSRSVLSQAEGSCSIALVKIICSPRTQFKQLPCAADCIWTPQGLIIICWLLLAAGYVTLQSCISCCCWSATAARRAADVCQTAELHHRLDFATLQS